MSSKKVKWVSWSLVLIIPIFFIGCGYKEKKNILGSNKNPIVLTNPEPHNLDSDISDVDVLIPKSNAIVGIARYKSNLVSGLNTKGYPVIGVKFSLFAWDGKGSTARGPMPDAIAEIITDINGKFEFPNLSPGKYIFTTTDLVKAVYNLDFVTSVLSVCAEIIGYFDLSQSESITVNVTLYPKYSEKPPIPTYAGSWKDQYGNIISGANIPNLGEGKYFGQISRSSDFTAGGSNFGPLDYRSQITSGSSKRVMKYVRYKFVQGRLIVTKIVEKMGITNYDLFLPSGMSDWSDTLVLPSSD